MVSIELKACRVNVISHLVRSFGSLPEITVRTSMFAMASAYAGSFFMTCSKAACASSVLPRCSSATACATSVWVDDVDGACASSSKT